MQHPWPCTALHCTALPCTGRATTLRRLCADSATTREDDLVAPAAAATENRMSSRTRSNSRQTTRVAGRSGCGHDGQLRHKLAFRWTQPKNRRTISTRTWRSAWKIDGASRYLAPRSDLHSSLRTYKPSVRHACDVYAHLLCQTPTPQNPCGAQISCRVQPACATPVH